MLRFHLILIEIFTQCLFVWEELNNIDDAIAKKGKKIEKFIGAKMDKRRIRVIFIGF